MTGHQLHFIVPGSLEQRTGGYIYDRRIVGGLRDRDWSVAVHDLEGSFPAADTRTRASLADTLARLPDGADVVIDGLAIGGMGELISEHGRRLHLLALIHLLLSDDPGLEPSLRDAFLGPERAALATCRGVIVTSSFTAGRVQLLGIDADRIRTVPPGTDRARAAAGPGPDAPPRLLCVGSVTPGKGQDVLVAALGTLADTPWTCVCAGSLSHSPAFARAVQAKARDAGVSDRIEFPGEQDARDLEALYDASSVFVLPSLYEGYGMALTEAMARGLPVVSTTGGAIPDTVPAEAGILVAPGDAGALADALGQLLVDPPTAPGAARRQRRRLGKAARRHAAALPGWDQAADAFALAVSELSRVS